MKPTLKLAAVLFATLLVSACSTTDMDHFLASGPGDWSAAGSSSSTSSGGTYAPRTCYQVSRTHQACYN